MSIVRKRYLYLFESFVRALRDSWGERWGKSQKRKERVRKREVGGGEGERERERDERIYSEDEAKGECGPLVVTGLFCVSVEKNQPRAPRKRKTHFVLSKAPVCIIIEHLWHQT